MLLLDSVVGADGASGTTNWSYTHALNNPAPDAILVLLGHQFNGDFVSGVSFGGVALTRIGYRPISSAGDSSPSYAYFRNGGFDGLAAGNQTVSITEADNTAKVAGSIALFAHRGVEVVRVQGDDFGLGSNPTATVVVPKGRPLFIGSIMTSGNNTIGETPAAGQSLIRNRDYGSTSAYINYKTSIAVYTADPTMGWTDGSFSHTMLSVALAETLGPHPTNYQDPGLFAKAHDLWQRRGRIFVPRLWTPPSPVTS